MAFGFNEDKSKFTIPSDLTQIGEELDSLEHSVEVINAEAGNMATAINTIRADLTDLEGRVDDIEDGGSGGGGGGGGGEGGGASEGAGYYAGVDLVTKFATEIAQHASVAAWLNARAIAGNFDGLHVRDYVDVTLTNGTTMRYRIMDFDHDYGACGAEVTTHHVDMCPDQLYGSLLWNPTNNNAGTSSTPYPYQASQIRSLLISDFLPKLPTAWQNVLVNRWAMIEQKGPSDSDPVDTSWQQVGKVWLPSEVEVFGRQMLGSNEFGGTADSHYADFFKRTGDRVRRTTAGTRASWWTRTPCSTSRTSNAGVKVTTIYSTGEAIGYGTTHTSTYALPCFRVGVS